MTNSEWPYPYPSQDEINEKVPEFLEKGLLESPDYTREQAANDAFSFINACHAIDSGFVKVIIHNASSDRLKFKLYTTNPEHHQTTSD